jgi:hypothetical protein
MLLIGSRHRRDSCSEAYRFARSSRVPVDPKIDLDVFRTPLLGFIDRPSVDTTITASSPAWAVAQTSDRDYHVPIVFRSCRSSRLQRFATQRADPKTRSFDGPRVCCTPQPTMGFAQFRTPWLGLAAEPTTRRSWTRRSWGVFPCGEDPSKRSPPRQPSTMPSPRLVLSDAVAFTGWRSLSPLEPRPLACRHAALCCSRPQGFLPPRSPLRSCDVAVARPLDAPLGFGSTRFRRCRAHCAAQLSLDVSPGGPNRFGVPRPERRGKAGCFGPVWLHATESGCPRRDDRSRSRLAPAPPEGDTSAALHNGPRSGMPVDPPREEVHRAGPTPEGVRLPTSSRRISEETRARPSARSEERRPVVRAPSLRPSAVARVHEERPLAADVHTRRCARLRATRAHPRLREGSVLRRTRHQSPEGLERWASRRHHPEVGPWRLVAPASPASWSAGSGPDSRRVHRDGRDSIRRRSLSPDPKIGLTGAEAPWVRSVRTSHLWW